VCTCVATPSHTVPSKFARTTNLKKLAKALGAPCKSLRKNAPTKNIYIYKS
jgi:hypothetical protein